MLNGQGVFLLAPITGDKALTIGASNPFRYKGYYYDTETGLYYLNSRYYNPEWGRFISADSVLGKTGVLLSHNLFVYCANSPVMASDPSGNFWYYGDEQQSNSTSFQEVQMYDYADLNLIIGSKGGPSKGFTDLRGIATDEISRRAKDRSLSVKERRRYQTEEKFRKVRDVKTRKEKNYSVAPEEPVAIKQFIFDSSNSPALDSMGLSEPQWVNDAVGYAGDASGYVVGLAIAAAAYYLSGGSYCPAYAY